MHIGKANDIALRMECDYGKIKCKIRPSAQDPRKIIRTVTCNTCSFETDTKGGIKFHVSKTQRNYKSLQSKMPLLPKKLH